MSAGAGATKQHQGLRFPFLPLLVKYNVVHTLLAVSLWKFTAPCCSTHHIFAIFVTNFETHLFLTSQLPVSDVWTATLELAVCLLWVVLPKDFKRLKSFVGCSYQY